MPTYGESKARDMARTFLVSRTRSKLAKRRFHHRKRAQVRQALRQVKNLGDVPTRFNPKLDQQIEGPRWAGSSDVRRLATERRRNRNHATLRHWIAKKVAHLTERDERKAEINRLFTKQVVRRLAKRSAASQIDPDYQERPSSWWNRSTRKLEHVGWDEAPALLEGALQAGLLHKLNQAVAAADRPMYRKLPKPVEQRWVDGFGVLHTRWVPQFECATTPPPELKSIADIPRFLAVIADARIRRPRHTHTKVWSRTSYSGWFEHKADLKYQPRWWHALQEFLRQFRDGEVM